MDLKAYIAEQKAKIKEPVQKQYAIGKDIISQEQFDFMKGCFAEGVLPPDFTAVRRLAFSSAELAGIPDEPVQDCDVLLYKGKVFAEFKTISWHLQIPSEIEGIPPITEYDLQKIYKHVAFSTTKQLSQWDLWRQPDTLEELIRNTTSDVGTTDAKDAKSNDEILI